MQDKRCYTYYLKKKTIKFNNMMALIKTTPLLNLIN